MKRIQEFYQNNFNILLTISVLGAMYYAFHRILLVDDAFISFRYAKNLASGNGLVWNIGERVEGYSNFLWTFLIAGALKLGIKPELSAVVLNVPIHLAALITTYLLALKALRDRTLALTVLLLTGFNHTVAGFATSGLETSLQLLEYVAAGLILFSVPDSGWSKKRTILFSIVLNLALITRPDGGLLVMVGIFGWVISNKKLKIPDYAPMALPFILIVLPWLIWKAAYYGSLLPNSFNAKVHGISGTGFGFYYIYLFIIHYFLLPYVLLVIGYFPKMWQGNRKIAYTVVFCGIWIAYVIAVGGDFMEYRFLEPVLPYLFIAILAVIRDGIQRSGIQIALIIALLLGTLNNAHDFARVFYATGVEKIESLRNHLYAADENWVAIGKQLKRFFEDSDVKIGVGAAGAMPYYSELPALDFLGLTDKEVPKIAETFSGAAGHRIIAPLDYLKKQNVNLIIQPIRLMFTNDQFRQFTRLANWGDVYRFFMDVDKPVDGKILQEATMIGIPIEKGFTLVVWYFTPHERIEEAIRVFGLKKFTIRR